ncbi:MAG: trigger factor, partial [Limisphaerales bacterium]
EMTQRVEELAAQYQTTPEKLVKEIQNKDGFHQIYEQLMNEKVIDWLVQNAKIEDVAPKPA